MTNPKTKAIIFAHYPYALQKLWGMTLLEKLVRQLSVAEIEECIIVFDKEKVITDVLRSDFQKWHKIGVRSVQIEGDEVTTLSKILEEDSNPFIVLQGNAILDSRIIIALKEKVTADKPVQVSSGENSPFAFSIKNDQLSSTTSHSIQELISDLPREVIKTSEMDSYIGSMRRRQEPFLFKIDSESEIEKASKIAFTAIYKGATDFITKYAWPLPTRLMVHWLSPTNITPNQITYVSMILSFGAIPFFFMGWFWPAWFMGTVMSFLDTLDGKLARLTLRTSETGHWLDNASDTIYLWLWYAGIGWYFSEDLLNFSYINTIAAWSLVGLFTIDKIVTGLFKKLFGAQLHDFAPIDWHARIYIARRNPFLVVLLIGLVINQPVFSLHAMAIWQTATCVFHMIRFIYLPLSGQKHQVTR